MIHPNVPEPLRDNFPRIQHVGYLAEVLRGVAAGRTFDEIRTDVRRTSADLTRRTGGRVAAARVSDEYTLWSVTASTLQELMRLGLVGRQAVPSKRALVDQHRDSTYQLTETGQDFYERTTENEGAFLRALAPLVIDAHPFVSSVLRTLAQSPVVIPEYTEEGLRALKDTTGVWITHLGSDVVRRTSAAMPHATVTAADVTAEVTKALRQRFAGKAAPTPKEVLDVVQDAVLVCTLRGLGLRIDAISFNVLTSWCAQMYLLQESRYVHGFDGRVVWNTADVSGEAGRIRVEWRGLAAYGERVARAVGGAYREIADDAPGGGPGYYPYVPIYEVRATAAYRVGVTDQVVDRVIADMADGLRPEVGETVLGVGQTRWTATSERPFEMDGTRFYIMYVKPQP